VAGKTGGKKKGGEKRKDRPVRAGGLVRARGGDSVVGAASSFVIDWGGWPGRGCVLEGYSSFVD